jgi:gelsolin
VVFVLVEGDTDERFWSLIEGGAGPVAAEAPHVAEPAATIPKLYCLSDASGEVTFTLVGQAPTFPRSALSSHDVFILDTGRAQVFAWVGDGSSREEQHQALLQAQKYLVDFDLPPNTHITKVKEGAESAAFLALLH